MNNSELVKQQLEAHHNLYTQRIAKLEQENEELKEKLRTYQKNV